MHELQFGTVPGYVPDITARQTACDDPCADMEEGLYSMFRAIGSTRLDFLRRESGADGDYSVLETGLGRLNRVFDFQGSAEGLLSACDRERGYFNGRGLPWQWIHSPSCQTRVPEDALKDAGLEPVNETTGMYLDLKLERSATARCERSPFDTLSGSVLNHGCDNLSEWQATAGCAYPFGGVFGASALVMLNALATSGEVFFVSKNSSSGPLATAAVHLRGDCAGLYWVACLPEARGQGHTSCLIETILEQLEVAGIRRVILHASAMARSLYARLGFQECGAIRIYEAAKNTA